MFVNFTMPCTKTSLLKLCYLFKNDLIKKFTLKSDQVFVETVSFAKISTACYSFATITYMETCGRSLAMQTVSFATIF